MYLVGNRSFLGSIWRKSSRRSKCLIHLILNQAVLIKSEENIHKICFHMIKSVMLYLQQVSDSVNVLENIMQLYWRELILRLPAAINAVTTSR